MGYLLSEVETRPPNTAVGRPGRGQQGDPGDWSKGLTHVAHGAHTAFDGLALRNMHG